jgi:hypothetical protein
MKPSSLSKRWLVACGAAIVVAAMAAACGGSDTTTTPPAQTATLTGIAIAPTSVAGGGSATGTVTFSSAPSSAASVALSSNSGAASVPGTVTVNAGATSATFAITTTAVGASTNATVTATFSGSSVAATLTVTPPVLAANFVVRSLSPAQRKLNTDPTPVTILPTGTPDACPLVNTFFDCQFDGSASSTPSGPIQSYIWTYFVGPRARTEPSTSPIYKPTESSCNFFGGLQTVSAGGLQFVGMRVDLQVRDAAGNTSAVTSNQNVRIFPAGQCNYGF